MRKFIVAVVAAAEAKEWWRQEPCAMVSCMEEKFSVPMYDPKEKKCVCAMHPCMADPHGNQHSCGKEAPYLHYRFDKPGKLGEMSDLKCECSSHPQLHTLNMERACGGNICSETTHPVLAMEENGQCHCRANPCEDDNGKAHRCDDPSFPILRFSHTAEGELICQCYGPAFGGHWWKLQKAVDPEL
jgi:hypothetical protein